MSTSENVGRLHYDHGSKSTSDGLFRADDTHPPIGVVQIAVCKLSHVLGSESGLVGGRDQVMGKDGLRVRARLRKVAKEVMVHWHLQ